MSATLNSCSDRERLFAKYVQMVLEHRLRLELRAGRDAWAVAEFVSRLRQLDVGHAIIEEALGGDAAVEAREILEAKGW